MSAGRLADGVPTSVVAAEILTEASRLWRALEEAYDDLEDALGAGATADLERCAARMASLEASLRAVDGPVLAAAAACGPQGEAALNAMRGVRDRLRVRQEELLGVASAARDEAGGALARLRTSIAQAGAYARHGQTRLRLASVTV